MSKRMDGFTRRDFLNRLAVAGAVTVGSGVLAACGGGEDAGGDSGDGGAMDSGDDGGEMALNCSDPESLTDVETTQRDALQYIEVSEIADQNCTNCNQYVVAESSGGCGTCKVVPGPINPDGHCSVWVALEEA